MRAIFTWTTIFVLACAGNPVTADCLDVITNSKVVRETVQDSSQLEAYARNFCSEYASSNSGSRSASFGISYSILSASFGEGSASEERIASRYCDAGSQKSVKADAYRQYVETIAPGAYTAYLRCVELSLNGVKIDVNSVLSGYLTISVSFTTNNALATQVVDFSASPDVNCKWNNGEGTKSKIPPNSSDILVCTRPSFDVKSAINVFPTSKPNSQFSFTWDRYQGDLPVDQIGHLIGQVRDATSALGQVTKAMGSSVVAFNLSRCPHGWKEYTPAFGRFIRGIDRGSNKEDPDGERVPGAIQGDLFAAHSHTRPKDVYDAGGTEPGSGAACQDCQGWGFKGLISTGVAGGPENRPDNVALLYCTPEP